ncbi:hypothetical protein M1394_01200 [Candidatus Marsarchaeota archaeon]|nr:hypothetical protein [Candidatus Marsarchaeota archaeon]
MQRIVVPGERLEEKPVHLENTIIHENNTYSTVMGIYDNEKRNLVPLEGIWYPRHGDEVIGVVEEEKLNVFTVNLHSTYKGIILVKYSEGDIAPGDIIEASVKELDKTKTVVLVRPRKLSGGKILAVKPTKIPRILGKGDSMITQLTEGTKTFIKIGMNGVLWMRGGNLDLATKVILRIEEEPHKTGITERIKTMLEKSV